MRCTGSPTYPNSDGRSVRAGCSSFIFIVLVRIFILPVIVVLVITFNRLYISTLMNEQN